MKARFISPAAFELDEAVKYYDHQLPGLGYRFFQEIAASIERILLMPEAWQKTGKQTIRCILKGFPYALLYVREEEEIHITAAAHLHRDPKRYRCEFRRKPIPVYFHPFPTKEQSMHNRPYFRTILIGFLSGLIVFAAAGFPFHAEAGEIVAQSRLIGATIYPNRATLTREAVVDLPAGASVIVFQGLPANLLTDSLRTEGESEAKVRFSALTHRLETQTELIAPREQELVARIEQLQDQRKGVEAERKGLAAQRQFIENIGQQAGRRVDEEIVELRLNPGEWNQAAEVIGSSLKDILKADLAHQLELRDLDRKLKSLETELSQLQTGLRNSYSVQLPLEADEPTRLSVRLQYQVPGVSWRPVYDARLDTETGELSLVQYGSVRQNTGEDWIDVQLVLSTAQPHRGAGLPDLKPLWVDLYDPARRGRVVMSEMAKKAAPQRALDATETAGEGALGREEAEFVGAEIRTGGFVTEYVIPGRVSVKADGTESKLMCGAFETDNRMQIQIKPQVSNEAFVVSRAVLKGEAPLLPGAAGLFRDGAYVGRLQLPLLRPGQAQDIGFGIDDRIAVTRSVLKDMHSDPTLLSRENQLERHMATVIMNQGPKAVDVVVLETSPAARHDRIKVEVLKDHTTRGYEQDVDDVKGLLRWSMPLAAGEEARVTLGWRISWPKDQELSGL